MLRDLKWGVGGGLLMIVLGHVAGLVGVLSSLQVTPLVAGGVGLILLTTIYLLGRLAPASGGSMRLLAPPVTSPDDESQIVRTTLVLEGRRILERWAQSGRDVRFTAFLEQRGFFLELRPHFSPEFHAQLLDAEELGLEEPLEQADERRESALPAALNAEIMRLERQWCVRFSRTPIWAATNPSEFLTGKPATNCEPSRHR